MTVRRERVVRLASQPEAVRAAIERLLASERKYRVESQQEDDWTIRLRPAGWPLVLSTRLKIRLSHDGDRTQTTLRISAQSQRCIFGDVFGMYSSYVNELATALELEAR